MSKKIFLVCLIIIFSLSCAKRTRNPYDPIDKEFPSGSKIIINSGDAYTNTQEVDLTLQSYDAFKVKVANTKEELDSKKWELFKGTKEKPYQMNWPEKWKLSIPVGAISSQEILIYAKFKDKAENETGIITGSIVVDNVPPEEFKCYAKIGRNTEQEVNKHWKGVVKERDEITFVIKSNEKDGDAKVYIGYTEFEYEEYINATIAKYPCSNVAKIYPLFKYVFEDTIQIKIAPSKPPKVYTELKKDIDFILGISQDKDIKGTPEIQPVSPRTEFTKANEYFLLKLNYTAFPVISLKQEKEGVYTATYVVDKTVIEGRILNKTTKKIEYIKVFPITWVFSDHKKGGTERKITQGEIEVKFETDPKK